MNASETLECERVWLHSVGFVHDFALHSNKSHPPARYRALHLENSGRFAGKWRIVGE